MGSVDLVHTYYPQIKSYAFQKSCERKNIVQKFFLCYIEKNCAIGNFSMRYLICYDIPDDKTRDNIVYYLERFAWRVQYSVFSCRLDKAQATLVWRDLLAIAATSKGSSVLMTPLCKSCEKNLQLSAKPLEEEKGFLVV